MGTLSGGNGGGSSDGGGDAFDGLPGLPPEWGNVVVPDDPAELAEEAAEVRRELRRESRRSTWRRWLGLSAPGGRDSLPSPRLPVLIMTIAVIAALISMIAMGWQREALRPPSSDATRQAADTGGGTTTALRSLPALDLTDSGGGTTSLRSLAPSVILLTDSCDCAGLVAATAVAVPDGVHVVTVARTSSPPAPATSGVRSLGDPTGELRKAVGLSGDGQAVVLLVDSTGKVVRALTGVTTVDAFRAELAGLAG